MKLSKTMIMAGLIAGSLVMTNSVVRAQGTTNAPAVAPHPAAPPHAPVDFVARQVDSMTKQLSLTDEQKGKIKPVLEESRQKRMALGKDTSLTPADRQAKAKEIQADVVAKFKEILTPEQFEKWQQMSRPHPRPMPTPGSATNKPAATAPTAPAGATANQ
jgi:Spy/CpxP family protein refolding chaperone